MVFETIQNEIPAPIRRHAFTDIQAVLQPLASLMYYLHYLAASNTINKSTSPIYRFHVHVDANNMNHLQTSSTVVIGDAKRYKSLP